MRWPLVPLLIALVAVVPGRGRSDDSVPTSTQSAVPRPPHGLFGSLVTAAPYLGVIGFENGNDNYTVRGLGGFTVDLFLSEETSDEIALNQGPILYGMESGLLYTTPAGGSYAVLLPILFKGTRRFADRVWVDGTLGAELLYRSNSDTMDVGRLASAGSGNTLQAFPALGVTVAYKMAPAAALSLRADYIPTPADDMFSAVLGVIIPLG